MNLSICFIVPEFGFRSNFNYNTSEEREDDERLQLSYTDFAKANGLEMVWGDSVWWLRSPATSRDIDAYYIVTHRGNASSWIDRNCGVVPAFCLK